MNTLTSRVVKASDSGWLKSRKELLSARCLPGRSHIAPNNKVYSIHIWHGDREALVWGIVFILTQGSPLISLIRLQPPAMAIRQTHPCCFISRTEFSAPLFPSSNFFSLLLNFTVERTKKKKKKKKSAGVNKASSFGAVLWMLQPLVKKGLFREGQWVTEVCSFVPTTVHQSVQKRDCAAPSFSFLVLCMSPGKPFTG